MRARVIQVKEPLLLPWFRKQTEHTLQNAEGVGGKDSIKNIRKKILRFKYLKPVTL